MSNQRFTYITKAGFELLQSAYTYQETSPKPLGVVKHFLPVYDYRLDNYADSNFWLEHSGDILNNLVANGGLISKHDVFYWKPDDQHIYVNKSSLKENGYFVGDDDTSVDTTTLLNYVHKKGVDLTVTKNLITLEELFLNQKVFEVNGGVSVSGNNLVSSVDWESLSDIANPTYENFIDEPALNQWRVLKSNSGLLYDTATYINKRVTSSEGDKSISSINVNFNQKIGSIRYNKLITFIHVVNASGTGLESNFVPFTVTVFPDTVIKSNDVESGVNSLILDIQLSFDINLETAENTEFISVDQSGWVKSVGDVNEGEEYEYEYGEDNRVRTNAIWPTNNVLIGFDLDFARDALLGRMVITNREPTHTYKNRSYVEGEDNLITGTKNQLVLQNKQYKWVQDGNGNWEIDQTAFPSVGEWLFGFSERLNVDPTASPAIKNDLVIEGPLTGIFDLRNSFRVRNKIGDIDYSNTMNWNPFSKENATIIREYNSLTGYLRYFKINKKGLEIVHQLESGEPIQEACFELNGDGVKIGANSYIEILNENTIGTEDFPLGGLFLKDNGFIKSNNGISYESSGYEEDFDSNPNKIKIRKDNDVLGSVIYVGIDAENIRIHENSFIYTLLQSRKISMISGDFYFIFEEPYDLLPVSEYPSLIKSKRDIELIAREGEVSDRSIIINASKLVPKTDKGTDIGELTKKFNNGYFQTIQTANVFVSSMVNISGLFLQMVNGGYIQTNGGNIETSNGDVNAGMGDLYGNIAYVKKLNDNFHPPIQDYEGNTYRVVKIGNQLWTIDNYRSRRKSDGTWIPYVTVGWSSLSDGACRVYDDVAENIKNNGLLYNWWAMGDLLMPEGGWGIPTKDRFDDLLIYLNSIGEYDSVAKSLASNGGEWNSSVEDGEVGNKQYLNNLSGFSALPSGSVTTGGVSVNKGDIARFWNTKEISPTEGQCLGLDYNGMNTTYITGDKKNGLSIRLVKPI